MSKITSEGRLALFLFLGEAAETDETRRGAGRESIGVTELIFDIELEVARQGSQNGYELDSQKAFREFRAGIQKSHPASFEYSHGRFLNPINGAWEFNFETDVVMSSEEVVREEIVSEVWLKYNILI